jgi:hypothetical protein
MLVHPGGSTAQRDRVEGGQTDRCRSLPESFMLLWIELRIARATHCFLQNWSLHLARNRKEGRKGWGSGGGGTWGRWFPRPQDSIPGDDLTFVVAAPWSRCSRTGIAFPANS